MHKHLDSITFNGYTYEDVMVYAELRYSADDSLAITLDTAEDGPLATATVCLAGYGIEPPREGHAYIKDYAENTGMSNALIAAGLIEFVADFQVGPHASLITEARIKAEAWS